jgi:hypothetical protein
VATVPAPPASWRISARYFEVTLDRQLKHLPFAKSLKRLEAEWREEHSE